MRRTRSMTVRSKPFAGVPRSLSARPFTRSSRTRLTHAAPEPYRAKERVRGECVCATRDP